MNGSFTPQISTSYLRGRALRKECYEFTKHDQYSLPSGLFLATLLLTSPLITAAQGEIAFESLRDINREIYVMNPDGSNQTNLTNNPANDTEPSFSGDGCKISFVSARDGND